MDVLEAGQEFVVQHPFKTISPLGIKNSPIKDVSQKLHFPEDFQILRFPGCKQEVASLNCGHNDRGYQRLRFNIAPFSNSYFTMICQESIKWLTR